MHKCWPIVILMGSGLLLGCPDDPDDFNDDDDVADDDDAGESCAARYDDVLEAFEDERRSLGAPGVAVGIIEDGELACAIGLGSSHPDDDVPVRSTTLFRLASVTKMLTATVLLQQVEAGAVELDAPVTDYVPDFEFVLDASWADLILVEDTLLHSSGMFDHLAVDGYYDDEDLAWFFDEFYGANLFLMNPPGLFWNYSNPNYCLAGRLVEVATGDFYDVAMDERLFTPLGMDRTFFDPDDILADGDYAVGDAYDWTGLTNNRMEAGPDSYDNVWGRPAGFAWSSVVDMAHFVRFLMEGDASVLGDSWRQAMQSPQIDVQLYLDLLSYGYGLMTYEGFWLGNNWYDVPMVTHDGAMPGFSSELTYLPEQGFGLVILSNTDGAYYSSSLSLALATLVELPDPVSGPDATVDPDTFTDFVGTYADPYNVGDILITEQGGALHIEMPLLDQYSLSYDDTLIATSPDNFYFTVAGNPSSVTFIRDQNGDAQFFRTRYFVGEMGAARAGGTAPPPFDPLRFQQQLRAARHTRSPNPWFDTPAEHSHTPAWAGRGASPSRGEL